MVRIKKDPDTYGTFYIQNFVYKVINFGRYDKVARRILFVG